MRRSGVQMCRYFCKSGSAEAWLLSICKGTQLAAIASATAVCGYVTVSNALQPPQVGLKISKRTNLPSFLARAAASSNEWSQSIMGTPSGQADQALPCSFPWEIPHETPALELPP